MSVEILNSNDEMKNVFINEFNKYYEGQKLSKTCLDCLMYIK